jgi:hypothetical protein
MWSTFFRVRIAAIEPLDMRTEWIFRSKKYIFPTIREQNFLKVSAHIQKVGTSIIRRPLKKYPSREPDPLSGSCLYLFTVS